MTTHYTPEVLEQEESTHQAFRFPQFDLEQKEVRLKYNLIEE